MASLTWTNLTRVSQSFGGYFGLAQLKHVKAVVGLIAERNLWRRHSLAVLMPIQIRIWLSILLPIRILPQVIHKLENKKFMLDFTALPGYIVPIFSSVA
jgi:hypothetical protein